MDHVENARSLAGPQVEDAHAPTRPVSLSIALDRAEPERLARADFAAHPVECGNMPARQVDHVDVIAHARTIRCGIVVAEHADRSELANRDLRHIGHQVVGDALRVLADKAALVRTDRVEVAQQHDIPLVVSHIKVGEHLLKHGLRLAVRIRGGMLRALLGDGHELRLAIHRGARGEHNVLHTVIARDIAQDERARDVVPVVLKRLLHAFAHRLETGEVDDCIDVMLGEDGFHRIAVEHVRLVERASISADSSNLAHAFDGDFARVAQIVDDNDVEAFRKQLDAGVRADEPGAAGNQDGKLGWRFRQRFVCHNHSFLGGSKLSS